MSSFQLPNTFGVFLVLEILAAPFGYEGAGAIMNRQWDRAAVAYAIALPLALGGLLALGVPVLGSGLTATIGSFLINWLRPLSNPYFIVLLLVGVLMWIRYSKPIQQLLAREQTPEQLAALRARCQRSPLANIRLSRNPRDTNWLRRFCYCLAKSLAEINAILIFAAMN